MLTYALGMTLPEALLLAGALLALATVTGVLLTRREGRRGAAAPGESVHLADLNDAALGERATLVQFSTELCAHCPQVRRQLTRLAAEHPGVRHIEVDLSHRADLSRRYRVLQTPTTLLVDASGAVRARYRGVPQLPALTGDLMTLTTPSGAAL